MEGSDDFLLYPATFQQLGEDLKRLIDEYLAKKLPEEQLKEVLQGWQRSVPELLYEKDVHTNELCTSTINKSVMRHIGKKRGRVVLLALNR